MLTVSHVLLILAAISWLCYAFEAGPKPGRWLAICVALILVILAIMVW